nr:NAD(P)-dependent oxidoreductase [Anaerolineae bacterium]
MTRVEDKHLIEQKPRVRLDPIPKGYRAVDERLEDYEECAICLTAEEAMAEASRCLHCPDPATCYQACPIGNDISEALWYVEKGDFIKAAEIYRKTNPLPEICGRVCPSETTCASNCVLSKREKPINTRGIEAFVADYQRRHGGVPLPEKEPPTGKKVAIIGAGPAGIAASEVLAVKGHDVTVFEAYPTPGGLLVYGIPSFKLDKSLIQWKTDWLQDLGVKFVVNVKVGETISLDDLIEQEGFDAVFLGTGAGVEATMRIPGIDLGRIYQSIDFLIRGGNVPKAWLPEHKKEPLIIGKRVAVIGGGDTATDCLRTSLRLHAEKVTCYYRRTEAEMPGNKDERKRAIEEGAEIVYLSAPVEFLDRDEDGNVDAMVMIRMELGEPDESGRRRPVPVEGSEYEVEVDDVVLAIGFWPDPLLGETTPDLETQKWGLFKINQWTNETSREGIFAGGDAITGPALVNAAIASGKKAAEGIHKYLTEPSLP